MELYFISEDHLNVQRKNITTINKLLWHDKTKRNPGVLVSSGYPVYYSTGAHYAWIITFAVGHYVNMMFSNISLNQYQVRYHFSIAAITYQSVMKMWHSVHKKNISTKYRQSKSRSIGVIERIRRTDRQTSWWTDRATRSHVSRSC